MSNNADSDRLDSWKQIAAYLKRDVRTVQRWERLDGLPVHRSPGAGSGSVFAYRAEIDRWRDRPLVAAMPERNRRRRWRAALLAAAACSSLGVVSLWTLTARETQPPLETNRVWQGRNRDGFGAVSWDGRLVSFADPTTDRLAVAELAGGTVRSLTEEAASRATREFTVLSAFSRDATQIAYTRPGDDDVVDLRVASLDGVDRRVVLHDPQWQSIRPIAWTARDEEILCVLVPKQGVAVLAFVRAADGRTRTVKAFAFDSPRGVSLSPDDRVIVYDAPSNSDRAARDLFAIGSDGTHDRALTGGPANDVTPAWASDGQTVVFASDRGGAPGLWAMSVDATGASEPRLLKAGMPITSVIGLTRDGVVFAGAEAPKTEVYTAALDPRTGAVLEAPVAVPGHFADFNIPSDWSPDGRSLVYRSRRGADDPSFVLTVRTMATGEERQYPLAPSNARNPRWSPDHRVILFAAPTTADMSALYLLDLATGAADRIFEGRDPVGGFGATWSADAQAVFFTTTEGEQQAIARLHLASRRVDVIHRPPLGGYVGDAAVSPDGGRLAVRTMSRDTNFTTTLALVSLVDGTVRELTRWTAPETALGPAWTRDGRHLLFVKSPGRTPDHRQVWRIEVATGHMSATAIGGVGLASVRAHPDGRQIAFSARGSQAEVWAIRNLLRMAKPRKGE